MPVSTWSAVSASDAPAEPPSWLAGALSIGTVIGRGGMGVVWRATDRGTGEPVALKVLRVPSGGLMRRLKREFRLAQGLTHPNLVSLRELYSDGEAAAFTMELVEGESISALDAWALRAPLGQVCAALAALHAAGLVHRDVKPSNVLVEATGRAVLLDLGLALPAGEPATHRADGLGPTGTPGYLSPQAWRGAPPHPADDLWALGALVYACLAGREPTHGDPATQLWLSEGRWFPSPLEVRPSVPPDLSNLAMELLDPDAARRPDAETVAARLASAAASVSSFWVRRSEQDQLRAALGAAARDGGCVVLTGGGGAGKSSLIRREVNSSGCPVLWGRASPVEHLPYQALDAALDDLGALLSSPGADVAVPGPAAAMFPALRGGPIVGDAPVDAARAARGLRRLLADVAGRAGLYLVVDDLQWADLDSRRVLQVLLEAPIPGLVIVLVSRPEGRPLAAQLCAAAPVVELGALSPDAVFAGLAEAIGAQPAARIRAAVLADGAIPPASLPLLASLWLGSGPVRAATLDARIAGLPPEARRVLALTCLSAAPLVPRAYAALGCSEVAARALIADGLLCVRAESAGPTVVPVHDLVREAVLEADGAGSELHARLGRWLLGERNDAAAAHHLERAGEGELAREALVRAGGAALEQGAFAWSVDLYLRAVSLGVPAVSVADPLGLALASAGRHDDAVRVWLDGARASEGAKRARLLTRAADLQVGGGRLETGLGTLRLLLAEAGERLHLGVGSFVAYAWSSLAAAWWERWPGQPSPGARPRLDALWTSAITISPMEPVAGRAMQARYRAVAFAHGDDHDRLRALAAMLLLVRGEGRTVEDLERRVLPLLPGATPELRGLVHGSRGYGRRLACDFEGAEEELRAALVAFGDQSARHWQHRFCRLALLGNAAWHAPVPDLSELATEAMASAMGTGDRTAEVSVLLYLSWLVELLRDRPAEALAIAESASATWGRPLYMEQRQRLVMARLQCALYTRELDAADALVYRPPAFVRLMWRFRIVPFTWALAGGRLELLRGGADAAVERHAATLDRIATTAARGAALLLRLGLHERRGAIDEAARAEAIGLLRRGRHGLFADALLPDAEALAALTARGCEAPERVFAWARGRSPHARAVAPAR